VSRVVVWRRRERSMGGGIEIEVEVEG